MKVSLGWMEQFTPVSSLLSSKGAKLLAHEYSIHTAEVEGIEVFGTDKTRGVVVAKVLETRPHPNSDHLNLVRVSIGNEERNIVCGAKNVVTAKYVALATVGTVLGEDFEIRLSKIRGEESQGMICSVDELGLASERAEGILPLETAFDATYLESRLGTPFFDLETTIPGIGGKPVSCKVADTIFEIDNKFITNRPDLFSVRGNAREFSALYSLPLNPGIISSTTPVNTLQTTIESDKVLAYHLALFKNIEAKETPFGMSVLLAKSGQPVKFDLVDLTNYVMTEYGQPMHAFDADKVSGNITVRSAKSGEKMLALDGKEYTLAESDIVIADNEKVLAIAGVIGGMDSAITSETRHAIFESATFDAVSVRMTAARIGCRTDASTRYEKSQDPLLAGIALERTQEILTFLGKKSTPDAHFSFVRTEKLRDISIEVRPSFITTKLGRAIPEADIKRILENLGFTYTHKNEDLFEVKVPSWRATKDVSIMEDIVEEVGRVYGYDNIEDAPIPGFFSIAQRNNEKILKNKVADVFVAEGFLEAYTYSFSNEDKDTKALLDTSIAPVKILNAVSTDFSVMRRSIATSLFSVASENSKHSPVFAFFEIGKIHTKNDENDFSENTQVAGITRGKTLTEFRVALENVLSSILPSEEIRVRQGIENQKLPFLHPGKSGHYETENGVEILSFGYLHPEVVENFDLDEGILYFEMDWEILSALHESSKEPVFKEFSRFQSLDRELNFVLDEKIPTISVAETITSTDSRIHSVRVIDIYRDNQKVGEGKKSVTFSFRIEDMEKTLEDAELLSLQNSVVDACEKKGYLLRK